MRTEPRGPERLVLGLHAIALAAVVCTMPRRPPISATRNILGGVLLIAAAWAVVVFKDFSWPWVAFASVITAVLGIITVRETFSADGHESLQAVDTRVTPKRRSVLPTGSIAVDALMAAVAWTVAASEGFSPFWLIFAIIISAGFAVAFVRDRIRSDRSQRE